MSGAAVHPLEDVLLMRDEVNQAPDAQAMNNSGWVPDEHKHLPS